MFLDAYKVSFNDKFVVYPMKREVFEKRFPKRILREDNALFSLMKVCESPADFDMRLAPGGRMSQEIYKDPFKLSDWDLDQKSRCFIHIANSLV
ncbi:hypothetical protein ACFL2S_05705 [Thermodesulfobacteriota bacterium]